MTATRPTSTPISTPTHTSTPSSASPINPDKHKSLFLNTIQQSADALSKGDYPRAITLYTSAIHLDPTNHILYSNRSAAYVKTGDYGKALDDARASLKLNPHWIKAYLREGVALQCLGQTSDALASFSRGLAQDQSNDALLATMVDCVLKSPLKERMEPIFAQLSRMKLDKSRFVTVAVIGQELVASGQYKAAIVVLESALAISSPSQRLRGSVCSALSSCLWSIGDLERSLHYMHEDLTICKTLGDQHGECRVRGNLGSAHFASGNYKDALSNHRMQLVLAMKFKDRNSAASALSSLGHVYTAVGDYPNALASHKQCVILMKQNQDKLSEARQIGNVGAVYLAVGDFSSAIECHSEHLRLSKLLDDKTEEARALSNLGSAHHYMRTYTKAVAYHNQVLSIAQELGDKSLETRAYAGLGHATRSMGNYTTAKRNHELQLDSALKNRDKVAEGRACSNLGIIYHHMKKYDAAIKLHTVHYDIGKQVGDRASQGRALGNLGNAYSAMGNHTKAIELHEEELKIAGEVNDRHSEGSTHGNLAVSYQAINMTDTALEHYAAHLSIAQELKDASSEARALYNIGNFHSVHGNFQKALPYYEQYLAVSQEIQDVEGESKACFNLGYAHYALGHYLESIRYYNQDLTLARESRNQSTMARAYCNIGLAHKRFHNLDEAIDCQTNFYNISTSTSNTQGIFRALGNIADILILQSKTEDALKTYNKQLTTAKQCCDRALIAKAYCALGTVHKNMEEYDKSLGYFTQELNTTQELGNLRSESQSHAHIGSVHVALGNHTNAYKSYIEQLECAKRLNHPRSVCTAYANLANTKLNMGHYSDSAVYFEQQLSILDVHFLNRDDERGRTFSNLGGCYEAIEDYNEALRCYTSYLTISQQSSSLMNQDRAYRGLGNVHRSLGDLQRALVCFEKRLVISHETGEPSSKASSYGELGCLHSIMGNYEQAISCLEQELRIAQEIGDRLCEGEAACGLGGVYHQMRNYDKALLYHQMDLDIADTVDNVQSRCRAYGNLGLCHESMDNSDEAIHYQNLHLKQAEEIADKGAMTLAYTSLGRIHHASANYSESVACLQKGLVLAEQMGNTEDEAKIHHRLGLSLWEVDDLEGCVRHLVRATEMLEELRHNPRLGTATILSLYDLQTLSYQALQRVLVKLGQEDDALLMAEHSTTRAFQDLHKQQSRDTPTLLERNVTQNILDISVTEMVDVVTKQHTNVVYYSAVMGSLYVWVISPHKGIIKFHQISLANIECGSDTEDNQSPTRTELTNIGNVCGEPNLCSNQYDRIPFHSHQVLSETESEADDIWNQHLEELAEKLNCETDQTGFLKMVNRDRKISYGNLFNAAAGFNDFSQSSDNIENHSKNGRISWIYSLYELLLLPIEDALTEISGQNGSMSDLTLILPSDLLLVPFALLKPDDSQPSLCERFNLIVSPSLSSLQRDSRALDSDPESATSGSLIVGNPSLCSNIKQHWLLPEIAGSEYEARIVGELLSTRALIGHDASRENIMNIIEDVEVVHFACNISWKLSALFLASENDFITSPNESFLYNEFTEKSHNIEQSNEYLLTAAELMNLKLKAKLVVLSSGYGSDQSGRMDCDGLVRLSHALLAAGAQCIMYSLWPVPDQASKLLMRSVYTSLQNGVPISQALSQAMKTVASMKQFNHPRNWGGWVIMGHNVRISSAMARMGQALCELVQQSDSCKNTLRVLLHLIEKAQHRVHNGTKNSMYMTYESVHNKLPNITGWCGLLEAVGFGVEAAKGSVPCSIFFPHSDPADRLSQATGSIKSLLGLTQNTLTALGKFSNISEAGEYITCVVRDVIGRHQDSSDMSVSVRLWRLPGVHEFLASLGFDLLSVGESEVVLRMGRHTNRRYLQSALHSLHIIFDTQHTPRTIHSTTSMESLSSTPSSITTASSPPLSPTSRKRSLFNPAEMERVRLNKLMHQGGLVGRDVPSHKDHQLSPDPSICLSHQTDIRSRYPPRNPGHSSSDDSLDSGHSHLVEYRLDDRSSYNSSPRSVLSDSNGAVNHQISADSGTFEEKPNLCLKTSNESHDGIVYPRPRSRSCSASSRQSKESLKGDKIDVKKRNPQKLTSLNTEIIERGVNGLRHGVPIVNASRSTRESNSHQNGEGKVPIYASVAKGKESRIRISDTPKYSYSRVISDFGERLKPIDDTGVLNCDSNPTRTSSSITSNNSDQLYSRVDIKNSSWRTNYNNNRQNGKITQENYNQNNSLALMAENRINSHNHTVENRINSNNNTAEDSVSLRSSRGISPTFSIKTSPLVSPHLAPRGQPPNTQLHRQESVLAMSHKNHTLSHSGNFPKSSKTHCGKSPTSEISPSVPHKPSISLKSLSNPSINTSPSMKQNQANRISPLHYNGISRSGSSSSNQSSTPLTYSNLMENHAKYSTELGKNNIGNFHSQIPNSISNCNTKPVRAERRNIPISNQQDNLHKLQKGKKVSFTEQQNHCENTADNSFEQRNEIYKRNLVSYSDSFLTNQPGTVSNQTRSMDNKIGSWSNETRSVTNKAISPSNITRSSNETESFSDKFTSNSGLPTTNVPSHSAQNNLSSGYVFQSSKC